MTGRLLTVLLSLLVVLVLLAVAGMLRARGQNRDIESRWITAASQPVVVDLRPMVYAGLPAPVRRYFDFAFNGRTEIQVDWVDWTERGDFLLPIGPFRATGRQVNRAAEPVYAWTGMFSRFGLPLIESRDAFFLDSHDMRARLLGWLKVMHTDYKRAEDIASLYSYLVLRYYGQAPLMPWALLPNRFVRWRPRDDASAWLEVTRNGLSGRYLVTFGADGRIESMDTDRLLMEGNGTMQKESGRKLDYREVNGLMVPSRLEYRWTLADGSLISRYAFDVQALRYRHP